MNDTTLLDDAVPELDVTLHQELKVTGILVCVFCCTWWTLAADDWATLYDATTPDGREDPAPELDTVKRSVDDKIKLK